MLQNVIAALQFFMQDIIQINFTDSWFNSYSVKFSAEFQLKPGNFLHQVESGVKLLKISSRYDANSNGITCLVIRDLSLR